jgi:hypothetical protein
MKTEIEVVSRVDNQNLTQNFTIRIPLHYLIELQFTTEEHEMISRSNSGLLTTELIMNTLIMMIKKVREHEERLRIDLALKTIDPGDQNGEG